MDIGSIIGIILAFGMILLGAKMEALMVAIPGGDPSKMFPPTPGRYVLVDRVHDFMHADVFVLSYSTFDVSDERGSYEVSGLPPGEVEVNAFLPILGKTVTHQVVVVAGQRTKLDLTLHFDASGDSPAGAGKD